MIDKSHNIKRSENLNCNNATQEGHGKCGMKSNSTIEARSI